MVKSKKMSKSSIAVIVLAILLVLSMVLGLTGAWYSADKSSDSTGNSANVQLSDWMTLEMVGDSANTIKAYTKIAGADATECAKVGGDGANANNYIVMPGDTIKVDGTATLKISVASATDNYDFWYVTSTDGTTWSNDGTEGNAQKYVHTQENKVLVEATPTITVTGDTDSIVEKDADSDVYTVKTSLQQVEDTGVAPFANVVTFALTGKVLVRAIQINNLTATEAYGYLTANTPSTGWYTAA